MDPSAQEETSFHPFLSLDLFPERGNEDKSFLVKGERPRGEGDATGGATSELSVSESASESLHLTFLSLPFFYSLFPLLAFSFFPSWLSLTFIMLIQRMLSTLQVYCGTSILAAKERCSRPRLSLWMYTPSIRYCRLTCSFQYESPP